MLSITKAYGEQSDNYGAEQYGEHYVVNYSDKEILKKLDDWQKEQSPKF